RSPISLSRTRAAPSPRGSSPRSAIPTIEPLGAPSFRTMALFEWLLRRRRDREAWACRPRSLGEVEPELRLAPPREPIFFDASGGPLPASIAEALRDWDAVRGWVVRADVDRSDPEGPEYRIAFAWEGPGGLRHAD